MGRVNRQSVTQVRSGCWDLTIDMQLRTYVATHKALLDKKPDDGL